MTEKRPSSRPPSLRPIHPRPSRVSTTALRAIDFDLANAARRVVESALGVVAGESLVIVVDEERREVGTTLAEVARSGGASATLMELKDFGPRPVRRLPDALRVAMEAAQASILLVGFEDGELTMRLELLNLVRSVGLRHAHMVGVTRKSMLAGFSIDPARILDTTRGVRMRLRPNSIFRLRTAAGSDLEVKLDPAHRWCEHVGVIRPGRWENLPTGELMTSPLDVSGVFVCDASMGGHFGQAAGLLTKNPVHIEIGASYCKSVRCADVSLQRDVMQFLRSEANGDRVGIVTLGTNVGMVAAIGDILCDQNLPGLHLGFGSPFGDQTGAAWASRAQLTMTCASADVDLDGAPLLRHGRYMLT